MTNKYAYPMPPLDVAMNRAGILRHYGASADGEQKKLVVLADEIERLRAALQRIESLWPEGLEDAEQDMREIAREALRGAAEPSAVIEPGPLTLTHDPLVQCRCGWRGKVSELKPTKDFQSVCPNCAAWFKPIEVQPVKSSARTQCPICETMVPDGLSHLCKCGEVPPMSRGART